MKGCLKLSPTPSLAHDSQGQHHGEHGEALCYHAPITPTSASSPTTALSYSSTDAAHTTPSQAHTPTHRKCVAFCAEGSETVYPADEWDRTPAEPARKLSYQDLLELKEIQRSLPHANQPPDVVTGRPGKQFLLGVPIVLLPLLSSSPTESGEHSSNGAQETVAKTPCYSSGAPGRSSASGTGWGPPSITRKAQTTPARPAFPFPPRPVPFSGPASKSNFASAATSPSSITQPLRMNFQSPNKTGSASSPPSSPTSPYPSSYSNRPSTTSTSATHPYSSFHQQSSQTQSRASWTPPPSLSHLIPSSPIKPREKPKFEFITLLDPGTKGSFSPAITSDGPNGVEGTTTKVRPEVPLDSISKLPSGLTEIERDSGRDHHDDEHDLEDHDQDHDLISVTSSSSCPSLCTSSCPSCSASEVDTDHEPEIETQGRSRFLKGFSANSSLSSSFPSPFDLNVGLPLAEEVERHKTIKKPEPKKRKERKFILVNDMEIELDDSGSESEGEGDFTPLSGSITSTSTSTTREVTTTTTRKITSTTTTTTTTTTSESPLSPRSIVAPMPVKSTLLGSSSSSSMSLITPPTTPPSEQISRSGSRNKSLHSPSSSPTAGRGRIKKAGHVMGSSTSRERSGSTGSDTTSPSRSAMTGMCLPVKFKSKSSQEAAGFRV